MCRTGTFRQRSSSRVPSGAARRGRQALRGSSRTWPSYLKRGPRGSLLLDSRQDLLAEYFQETLLIAPDLVQEDHVETELDVLIEPLDVLLEIRGHANAPLQVIRLQRSGCPVEPLWIRNFSEDGGRKNVRPPLFEGGLPCC